MSSRDNIVSGLITSGFGFSITTPQLTILPFVSKNLKGSTVLIAS
jgi:hypothetical protein